MIEDILNSFYREGIIKWREVVETITRNGKAIPRIRKELLFVAQHKEELSPVVIERVKREKWDKMKYHERTFETKQNTTIETK